MAGRPGRTRRRAVPAIAAAVALGIGLSGCFGTAVDPSAQFDPVDAAFGDDLVGEPRRGARPGGRAQRVERRRRGRLGAMGGGVDRRIRHGRLRRGRAARQGRDRLPPGDRHDGDHLHRPAPARRRGHREAQRRGRRLRRLDPDPRRHHPRAALPAHLRPPRLLPDAPQPLRREPRAPLAAQPSCSSNGLALQPRRPTGRAGARVAHRHPAARRSPSSGRTGKSWTDLAEAVRARAARPRRHADAAAVGHRARRRPRRLLRRHRRRTAPPTARCSSTTPTSRARWAARPRARLSTLEDTWRLSEAFATGALLSEATERKQWTTAPLGGSAPAWQTVGIGALQYGPMRGTAGESAGALTAAFTDPESGLTVVVALNNSTPGADFVRETAFALASLASKANPGRRSRAPARRAALVGRPGHGEDAGARLCPTSGMPREAPAERRAARRGLTPAARLTRPLASSRGRGSVGASAVRRSSVVARRADRLRMRAESESG